MFSRHEGCRCPDDYTGHHCEYHLEHVTSNNIDTTITYNTATTIQKTTNQFQTIKNTMTKNETPNATNELGATIVFICISVLSGFILLYIFALIRKIYKGEDVFGERERDVQHAIEMNARDDLKLAEEEKEVEDSVISKESEIL